MAARLRPPRPPRAASPPCSSCRRFPPLPSSEVRMCPTLLYLGTTGVRRRRARLRPCVLLPLPLSGIVAWGRRDPRRSGRPLHPLLLWHDITNDSPIVGLTAGGLHGTDKTPASTATKTRRRAPRGTPGSGEVLLRGQVKALLHKVEEEQGCAPAALVRPARIHALLGVSRSPVQLLAPRPANTPQIGPVPADREGLLMPDGVPVVPCVLEEEELLLPKLQTRKRARPFLKK